MELFLIITYISQGAIKKTYPVIWAIWLLVAGALEY